MTYANEVVSIIKRLYLYLYIGNSINATLTAVGRSSAGRQSYFHLFVFRHPRFCIPDARLRKK